MRKEKGEFVGVQGMEGELWKGVEAQIVEIIRAGPFSGRTV